MQNQTTQNNIQIIFYTHYMDDLLKKFKLTRFTFCEDIPHQQKDETILINELSWKIVSVKRHETPSYGKNISDVISDDITIEVLLRKNHDSVEDRGERILSCKELQDN